MIEIIERVKGHVGTIDIMSLIGLQLIKGINKIICCTEKKCSGRLEVPSKITLSAKVFKGSVSVPSRTSSLTSFINNWLG
jgi:hypothetical protein